MNLGKSQMPSKPRMLAEWEHQRAVMLTWPDQATDWRPYLADIEVIYMQIVAAIAPSEGVVIAARHRDEVCRRMDEAFIGMPWRDNITVYSTEINDTWARDYGPLTTIDEQGSLCLHDFRFNGWGEKYDWQADNAITRTLFDKNAFKGELVSDDSFVLEGGSIETDGSGLLLTTRGCLLAPHRNQPMTEEEITYELCQRLSVEHVVWIDGLQLAGDDTDGHIDTIVRLAPNKIVVYIDDSKITSHSKGVMPLRQQLEEAFRPIGDYHFVMLPMPERIVIDGEQLPATYANYLVTNANVLVPIYRQKERDAEAMQVIGQLFPTRKVVGIDAVPIIRQHGSVHCLTMQLY